jgi:phosphoribosyl 1,2-cyclic phosphodiesterase
MIVRALGSGSKGNCISVQGGGVSLLVDFGLCNREATRRMKLAGIDPGGIDGILFTHDHSDHYNGIGVFAKHANPRLYANEGTADGIDRAFPGSALEWTVFETSSTFTIGGLEIEPFSVSHDASDPVGYVFNEKGGGRLFIATDFGYVTSLVRSKLAGCDVVVLESNHDYEMLWRSDRPDDLKSRISGRSGHLSNEAAADLIRDAAPKELRTVLLAHLSEECNTPALALRAMREGLKAAGRPDVIVQALSQREISDAFTA